jgi:hypothetical protein
MSVLRVRKAVRLLVQKGDICILSVRKDDALLRKICTCIK